jgi:hypothetical protein
MFSLFQLFLELTDFLYMLRNCLHLRFHEADIVVTGGLPRFCLQVGVLFPYFLLGIGNLFDDGLELLLGLCERLDLNDYLAGSHTHCVFTIAPQLGNAVNLIHRGVSDDL